MTFITIPYHVFRHVPKNSRAGASRPAMPTAATAKSVSLPCRSNNPRERAAAQAWGRHHVHHLRYEPRPPWPVAATSTTPTYACASWRSSLVALPQP